ncbi:MAG: polysaccharide biosynthesis tyrosine autokinase, partial [Thermoguttaceae bacterium]
AGSIENNIPIKAAAVPLSKEEIEWRDAMVESEIARNLDVRQLNSLLLANEMELERIEKHSTRGKADSLYIRHKEEIAILQKKLEALKKELAAPIQTEVGFSLRAKRGDSVIGPNSEATVLAKRREELVRMRSELRGYEIAEANLRNAYKIQSEKFLKELELLSGENVNLTSIKDELTEKQAVLARIAERLIALETERSAPTRVIWHEPAQVPQAPVELLPFRNMALAGLLALCLPFALAVGWEGMARRIGGSEDLEQHLHLAVLGEIARLPTQNRSVRGSTGTSISSDLRVFQESIDSLRTALTLSDDLHNMRILAVTSAVNHEGKTSVASQLALSLARATGKMTLLIDGDMRSPDVHAVFGVSQGPGLAEVLSDQYSLAKAIVPTHNEHVHLLPAGKLKVSPHQLLGNGSWKSLLEQIPTSYGYVIVDTPPVLAASEALVLAKAADATLLCVMRDVSRADQVRKAAERLLTAGGRPVGTVLSGIPISTYKYGYGTYPCPSNT